MGAQKLGEGEKMENGMKRELKKKMSARERELTKDLDSFARNARSGKASGLIMESHLKPVSKQVLKEVRTSIFKLSQKKAAEKFHVSPKTWIAWESGQNPVSGPASLWIEAVKLFPKEVMSILNRLEAHG